MSEPSSLPEPALESSLPNPEELPYIKLAETLHEDSRMICDKCHDSQCLREALPITYLDGVRCNVKLCIERHCLYLEIETAARPSQRVTLYVHYIHADMTTATVEQFVVWTKTQIGKLAKLRFSKLNDFFVDEDRLVMYDMLQTIPTAVLGEDCSVCMEKCNFRPECGHYICIPCLVQIKARRICCPVCREEICP